MTTPPNPATADIVELRLIGEWLNARFPISEDSDGDRVLAAADELERHRIKPPDDAA